MNWSNIEKDVALQTESIVNASKRFDGETHVSIGDSSSIFVNNRLSLSSEYSPNNDVVFDGNASLDSSSINPGNHVMKVVFNEVSELRNALRLINSNLSKHDHDSMDLKRNHIQIFERLDLIEYSIKDDSLMASRTVTTIDDIHSELKKIESRLADMEQNHRSYSTQFASHESLRRACDSSLDQIHTLLTASMEESKNETYKISELSNALMGALINLSGDPSSRYHVDLLNSFKKDINKDRIMRAVTDSMLRAVDSSVEMHLKTSLSFMNTSIHDILSDIRSRQESFEKSIMVTMSQREHIGDGFAKAMKVDTAAALEAETSRHLSETAQTFPQFASSNELDLLNDQVKQLSADNMNSKDALITQTILINNIINSHQQDRNHSIDELSAVKSLAASVESKLSEFKQAVEYSNQLTKKSIEDSVNFNTNSIEITNSAIKRIESAIERVNLELDQRKAQGAEFAKKLEMHSKLMEASSRLLNSRIDELGRTVDSLKSKSLLIDEMSAAVSKCQQELMKCEDFKSELMLLQSKCTSYDGQMGILIDIQMKQSKYEELHAISLEMQSKFTKHDRVLTENDADLKSLSRELTLVNDDVSSLRGKLQMDANEMLSKLNRRADALDATQVAIDSRISSVGNDIIKKDQDMQDSMLRFSKKFDKIEADIQTRSSIIIDTQSKLHALAEEVSQFIQKTKIDDVVFGTQVDSLLSNLRSFKADNEESCAKISRKVDICEAELQSRFQMKCDKLEHQFVQSSDSVTRLLQTLDHVERTTFSKISEVTVELRSKLSDVLELVSRQSLRVDQANSEIHSKLNLSISNFEASFNEKYANFTKNIEICVETVNSNVYSYKNELAAHVDSTVLSLSMLAQQLVDMARLQARQDETNASVSNRLEEKCDIAVLNLKRECSDQIKIVQAALNEMNYDLLQLAGKISMSDALHLKHLIIGRDSQEKAESKRLFNEDQASLEVQLLDNTIREVNELQALTNVLRAKSLAIESTVDSLEKHVSELTKLDLVEFIIHVEQQFTKLSDEVKILQTSLISLESSIRHIETSHAMKGNAHIDDVVATVGELSVKSVRYHMKLDSLQTQIDLLQNEIMELTQLPHFSSDTSTTMAPTTAQPSAVTAVDDYETGSDSGSDIFPESVDVLKQDASNSSPLGSNMYSEHTAAQAVDSNPATDSVISSPANSVASKSDSFLSDDEESQASKERPHSVQAVEDEPSNAIGSSTGSSSIMRSGSLIGRNKKPPFSK